MARDSRNTKVLSSLIASIIIGAGLLLWMEPPARGWAEARLLVGQGGATVEEVLIEYAAFGESVRSGDYDCLIYEDGTCEWRPRGARLRLLVVGSALDTLPDAQVRSLLAVIGTIGQNNRGGRAQIHLHAEHDARRTANLPAQAAALTELLIRRGVIR